MIDYEQLTLDDYDHYLMSQATSGTPTTTPATAMSTPYHSNIPTTPYSAISTTSTSSLVTNVKLDVKQYPIFNGENSAWPKFKKEDS